METLVSLAFVSSVRGLPPKKDSVVASAEAPVAVCSFALLIRG